LGIKEGWGTNDYHNIGNEAIVGKNMYYTKDGIYGKCIYLCFIFILILLKISISNKFIRINPNKEGDV
jgi:hypothetical protein